MIVILSIFALSLSLSHCHEGHHHDEHGHGHHSEASGESFVIEATDENFEDIILNNEFVIAKFYAPWYLSNIYKLCIYLCLFFVNEKIF